MIINQLVLTITNKGNQAEMNINLNCDDSQKTDADIKLSKEIQAFLINVAKGIEDNINATREGKSGS